MYNVYEDSIARETGRSISEAVAPSQCLCSCTIHREFHHGHKHAFDPLQHHDPTYSEVC